jgi:hypothetical protein
VSISTRWYDAQHKVIILQFEGNWDWDDLSASQAEENKLAASVSYDVVAFVDMSQTNMLPNGNILANGRTSIGKVPDNVAQIIVLFQSRAVEVFAGLIVEMMPKWRNRVQVTKTAEEAQRLIAEAVAKNSLSP